MKRIGIGILAVVLSLCLFACASGEEENQTKSYGRAPEREPVVETGKREKLSFLSFSKTVAGEEEILHHVQYDAMGNLLLVTKAVGERELHRNFVCDETGRITSYFEYENGEFLGSVTFLYDEAGEWCAGEMKNEREERTALLTVTRESEGTVRVVGEREGEILFSQELTYDGEGRPLTVTLSRGERTTKRTLSYEEGLLSGEREEEEGRVLSETEYSHIRYSIAEHRVAEALQNQLLLLCLISW